MLKTSLSFVDQNDHINRFQFSRAHGITAVLQRCPLTEFTTPGSVSRLTSAHRTLQSETHGTFDSLPTSESFLTHQLLWVN